MFANLTVAGRLTLGFGALVALIIAMAGFGVYEMSVTKQSIGRIYDDRVVPLAQIKTVSDIYAVNVIDTANKVAQGMLDPKAAVAALDEGNQRKAAAWKSYTSTQMVDAEKAGIAALEPRFAQAQTQITALKAALGSGEQAQVVALIKPLYEAIDPISAELEKLVQVQLTEAKREYDHAQAEFTKALYGFATLLASAVALSALVGWRLIVSLMRQLGGEPADAARVASAIAAGDLSQPIAVAAGDHSSLMAQMDAMQESLRKVVATVRGNADSVATASAQIAQGNHDLSQRTEEQASSLQQTAATMEQLGTTVRHNADSAKQADQLAQGASSIAAQGGVVVNQVVSTMQGISESSRKIGEIIGTIDGIAFQTNILALNAAVEAARAGEQGRGFAVVAGEVRALAQRSAEAAKEIKGLIGRSVEQVEQGTVLVDQAGKTMGEIVGSIQRVSDIVSEITSASVEQSSGISQVGEAVSQMDQVTQQNAALVEQSAAAAESLRGQAQHLLQAVTVFRLSHESGASETPAAAPKVLAIPGGARSPADSDDWTSF